MEQTFIFKIWVLFILLGLSAFFSGSETGLFALTKIALEKIKKSSHDSFLRINKLLSQPRRTLITVLLGNEIVNIAFTVVIASIFYKFRVYDGDSLLAPLVPVLFAWPALLIFGEIIPKTVAIRIPERVARLVAPSLDMFSRLVYPVRGLLKAVTDLISRPFLGRFGKQATIIDEDFFKTFVEMGTEEGLLDKDERQLIERVFVLDDIFAEQIMTDMSKVSSVPEDISYSKLIELIKSQRYSRIPVYAKDFKEKIVGVLNIKDMLAYKYAPEKNFSEFMSSNSKKPVLIPPKTKILDLLKDFQLRKIHMGIVVDESGCARGLVTMEDILEELFGEIKDEYDVDEGMFEKLPDGNLKLDLRLSFVRFCELLNYTPQKVGYRTLGQFLSEVVGAKPKNGDETGVENYRLKIHDDKGKLYAIASQVQQETV